MLDVLLYAPEIPPNTGNIIRLCANAGAELHLIEPLGFVLDDKRLRRAGLDYHEFAHLCVHPTLAAYLRRRPAVRLFACSTRGTIRYDEASFAPGDALMFGSESRGLPAQVFGAIPPDRRLYIPMRPGNRSLNLSNAVAIVLFEAWRQLGFGGAAPPRSSPV
jgi:tRNA (cytidine/uridine-2'-O-)-methyltransferase